MAESYYDIEKRIIEMYETAKLPRNPNISKLVYNFNIFRNWLYICIQNCQNCSICIVTNIRLTENQEFVLIRWIWYIDSVYILFTTDIITEYINRILKQNTTGFDFLYISKNWIYNFIVYLLSDLNFVKQKSRNKNCLYTKNINKIIYWFNFFSI